MRPDRLWPVLVGVTTLLAGVGLLEWYAETHTARYEVIIVADSAGGDDSAEELTEQTWQSTTPSTTEHAHARQLLRRGEIDEALAIYETLVDPEDAPVPMLTEYTYALRRAGRCDDAMLVIDRARELAPDDGGVNLSLGLTRACVGDDVGARAAFERALELRPAHFATRISYGEFLERQHDTERAIEVLRPAAESGGNEERARALAALGRCLFDAGDRPEARAALDEAVRRAPARSAIWMSVARTYLGSDDPADHARALADAERATRLAPEMASAHSLLGRAYEKLGRRLDAIASYRRAAEIDPENSYALTRLVRLALEEEEFALARRSARGLLDIDAENAEYHFLHGLASSRTRDTDAARDSYMAAIRLRHGDYAEAWFNLGILERAAHNLEAARWSYTMAIKVRPNYEEAWNNLGLVNFDLGNYGAAEQAFRDALALREDYAAAWVNLGRTFAEQNAYGRAAYAYERALDITPANRIVRLRLAVAYRRIGRVEESIALYRAIVEDEPLYVAAWYNLGIALAAEGRYDEAREAYQTALGIDPHHRSTMKNLGLLEAMLGDNRAALGHLTDALDRDPADGSLRLTIARIALAEGDRERCAREAGVLLSQSPRHVEARALFEQCDEGD